MPVLASPACAEPVAGGFGLDALMAALARTRSAEARFTETRHLAVLDQPLVSSGELRFTAPDRLEKRTLRPLAESLVLEGSRLRIERPGHRAWTMELSERPEIAAFAESMRATLAGDRATLERHYTLEFRGGEAAWTLDLAPRDEPVRRILRQVRIEGAGDDVRWITYEMPGGDRSEMRVERMPGPRP